MNKFNSVKAVTTFVRVFIGALLLAISFTSIAEQSATINNETNTASDTELALQLEHLKSQVLQLNRELFILEEDLLFPASTQIAIFISVDTGQFFAIDSVEVKIDNKEVAGFLYTDRQRKALEQGGIQKLYLGNLKVGEYQLTAIFTGIDPEGRTVKRAASYDFEKDDDAQMIELKVVDDTSTYRSKVVVEEWVL
ncbi:AraC family transcriptional regulator [Colwellia echini]|uniref:AraC family transcriptional regulator n=1 Tax=Colwellia echini TaxID=1982103 RepID=A0ABY3MW21_9GAMM|nr:AraC family transcriptional regulator [Colwellia echini]TYK65405.1 AraC family transcriptional regulator [Colwellia echini]